MDDFYTIKNVYNILNPWYDSSSIVLKNQIENRREKLLQLLHLPEEDRQVRGGRFPNVVDGTQLKITR